MIQKFKLTASLCILLASGAFAQLPSLVTGTALGTPYKNWSTQSQASNPNLQVTGATDTLDYFFNKHYYRNPTSSNLNFLTIYSPNSGTNAITHCGAVFLNTATVTVTGLEGLVAKKAATTSASVAVKLYLCNVNASNLPVLPALDSVITSVNSTSGVWVGGNFNTPITLTGKFAVLFKMGSTVAGDTISLFLNNACNSTSTVTAAQRFGEGLGMLRFNGTFYPTTGVFSNGPTGNDYEFIVAPRVSFNFASGVTALTPSICTNGVGNFSNTTTQSALLENRQFNFNQFAIKWGALANNLMPPTDSIYNWTFVGSPFVGTIFTKNASATFNTAGNQSASLSVKYRKSANNAAFLTTLTDVASATLNVSNLAAPSITITGGGAVCAGSSATLTASGNTTFTWTSPASTSPVLVVTPASNAVYSVSANSQGCISSQTVAVNVVQAPNLNISGVTSVCAFKSFTLGATGASSYTWSTGSNSASFAVTSTSATVLNYTVSALNAPCPVTTAVISVTVNALPSVTLTSPSPTLCSLASNGTTVALTGLPVGGTYSGVNVSGGGVFTPNTTGTFAISYLYTDFITGCSRTATTSLVVSNCPVGITENTALNQQVVIVPNPAANGKVQLRNLEGINTLSLYNLAGELITTFQSNKTELSIDLSARAQGVYLIRITDSNNQSRSLKIVNQ